MRFITNRERSCIHGSDRSGRGFLPKAENSNALDKGFPIKNNSKLNSLGSQTKFLGNDEVIMESQKDNNFKNYFENLLDYQSNTIGKSKNFYDKFSKKESNKKHTLVGKNPCIHDSTKSGGGILPWTNTSYEDYMGFRKK